MYTCLFRRGHYFLGHALELEAKHFFHNMGIMGIENAEFQVDFKNKNLP
jgi:hypothetical protein